VNVLDGKHGDNTVFPCLESPVTTRFLFIKEFYLQQSAENHPINITKFEIPQVIAGEKPVKLDWMIVVIHYSHYITF
jgi:hypothetical protein